MTNGAARRKHNQWLRVLKLDSADAALFVDDLISEVTDGVQKRRRNGWRNKDIFFFTMKYMSDLTCRMPETERRAPAFRMALRQAWLQHPVEYFDLELLQQLSSIITSRAKLHSWAAKLDNWVAARVPRRIIPPIQLVHSELDRQVATDKPVKVLY